MNTSTVTATIHSEIAQTLTVSCRLSDNIKEIEFKENETKTVEFKI
jgi:hypothetical protein